MVVAVFMSSGDSSQSLSSGRAPVKRTSAAGGAASYRTGSLPGCPQRSAGLCRETRNPHPERREKAE